jgi:hypothetical protein
LDRCEGFLSAPFEKITLKSLITAVKFKGTVRQIGLSYHCNEKVGHKELFKNTIFTLIFSSMLRIRIRIIRGNWFLIHQSGKLDPDPYQNEKQDPDRHQIER